MKNKGFTLAEVLITLGIIGVVAAITIPSLITKYHRREVETKLKKFYSTMNQAMRMSIAENGEFPSLDTSNLENSKNVGLLEEYYTNNILRYMQGIHYEITSGGGQYIKVSLNDGSGFSSYLQKVSTGGTLWVMYCLNADEKHCQHETYDGKNQFLFYIDTNEGQMKTVDGSSQYWKSSCLNKDPHYRHGCAAWIKSNGWEIPKDYPWIK